MTDDEFDKIDDDFNSEFDFVDEDHNKADANANKYAAAPQPKKGGSMISKLLMVAIVGGGGYYGYSTYYKPAETTPPPAMSAPVKPPEAMAPKTDNKANDLAQSLDNAVTKQNADKLAAAIPDKTFDQVQQELKGATAAPPPKMQIPDEINATLDSISEEMTLNVNQIKNLEATITALAGTLDQLNKAISAMDNRVLSLTETADGLSQDLSYVKKIIVDEDLDLTNPGTLKFSNKQKNQPLSAAAPGYTVHAIIPGRAWLKSSSGQIMTVTEGDKIGDYGTIAVIDAANGLVRTSSGITFR